MPLPDIKGPDRQKPLCYEPKRDKFILYDELRSAKERIVPLEQLTHEQLKKLIVERNRRGSDYRIRWGFGGPAYSRDDMIREITAETDVGKSAMEAEISYLSDLLKQIEENL
ncbi:hypothetical protein ES703_32664 [subsurface metagenome]